jgi:hypothetical protein
MAEPLPEPAGPQTFSEPPDAALVPEIARKNLVWGWALFGLFCLLFAGTVLIALAYLWLD